MRARRLLPLFVAAALGSSIIGARAHAEERPRGRVVTKDRVVTTGPSRSLLRTGAWTLGLSYAPALVVATTSPLPEDRYLYAPVAGPWLDLANRDCDECAHENVNQVLLVTDGVIQGFGALNIIGAFLFVETRETTLAKTVKSTKTFARKNAKSSAKTGLRVRFAPERIAGGYGLKAIGRF